MKNTIKLTSILLLAALIICPFLLTDNVRVAFGVDVTKLSENSTSLQSMVREKLNTESYTLETLYGVDGEGRYTLVEGDNCYLIYYNALNDYMEYSTESNSVYFGMESGVKKVYAGPTYYMYEKGGHYYDLENDEQLKESEVGGLVQSETKMRANYAEGVQAEKSRANLSMSKSKISGSGEIPNAYYFENLRENIHDNKEGSCSYVAIEMLMAYYDTFYNDNVIEDKYDSTEARNFTYTSTTFNTIVPSDFPQSPGYNESFHSYLLNMGRENGYTKSDSNSLSIIEMVKLTEDYFETRNLNIDMHNTLLIDDEEFCKSAIRNGNPVVLTIYGTVTAVDTRQLNHAVVAYAYDDDGLIANFGWRIHHLKCNINGYIIRTQAFYIDFNSGKNCTNNYTWTKGGCSGTFCGVCNKVESIKHNAKYEYINNTHHYVNCDCKKYDNMKQGHAVKGSGNKKICMFCGATIDFGFVQIDSVNGLLRSTNGSYMLPNGIVVLQDADIDAYINGTLKFYNNDLVIA